jgi:hypothetical protein
VHKISVSKKLLCWDATRTGRNDGQNETSYNHFYFSDGTNMSAERMTNGNNWPL